MRVIGPVEAYRDFGLQDHSCGVHGDPRDYRPRLAEFFREGLERGLRVAYLGSGNVGELREHLDGLVDIGCLPSDGAVQVISFDEIYGVERPVDPTGVIEWYAASTQKALADGYQGLRISADVTRPRPCA